MRRERTMTQPITNEWIDTVKRLRAENEDLKSNLFAVRCGWFAYGILAGLGIAAILYAVARG